MNNNATSAVNDSMDVVAYYESLILDAVAQADAPLHEALVRSSVYRTINDSYERALAQLVIDGELLYANGEYSLAPDAANEVAEPAGEPVAADVIELEAVKSESAEGENTGDEDVDGAVVDDENVVSEEAAPEAVECDAEESEATEPETVERTVAEPEADEADIVEPNAVECDAAEPGAVEVAAEEPVTVEPATLEATAGDATEAEAVGPVAEEPEAVESVSPEDTAPMACGPISLRADSTLVQLKVNGRSWPIPVAVGVSYDKKPADGLSLMGYELPEESLTTAEQPAEQQEPVRMKQRESVKSGRPELTLSSEPQQLTISFSESIETAKVVAEPEPANELEQPALALESEPESIKETVTVGDPEAEIAPISESEPESEPEPGAMAASKFEPSEGAVKKLERPKYLSGWDARAVCLIPRPRLLSSTSKRFIMCFASCASWARLRTRPCALLSKSSSLPMLCRYLRSIARRRQSSAGFRAMRSWRLTSMVICAALGVITVHLPTSKDRLVKHSARCIRVMARRFRCGTFRLLRQFSVN